MKKILLLILAVCLLPAMCFPVTGMENLQFLKINPDARGASLNDGFVAVSDNVNSIYYNPAGLSSLNNFSVSLMHMMYIADTNYEYVALGLPLGDRLKAAVSLVYLNYGAMSVTTENNLGVYTGANGEFIPYNLALTGGLALKLNQSISLGANIKYASEDIAGAYISGIMGDAGIKINLDDIIFGAAVYNVGSTTGVVKAPIVGRAGAATKFSLAAPSDLTIAGGANYVLDSGKIAGSIGAEFVTNGSVFFRGSYELGRDINALNAGVGIKSNMGDMKYWVDYNLSFLGNLGTTHRISFTVAFGTEDEKEKSRSTQKKTGIRTFNIK